jgi:fructoselysine-6-P-deglycase FrlB-like protein
MLTEEDLFVTREIAAQPDCWARAVRAADSQVGLPEPGENVAVIGCGTSWFMAMAYAALREKAGHGRTDAFTASEFPRARQYDRLVAISRSGTTTEVLDVLASSPSAGATVALTAVPDTPIAAVADTVVDLSFADERSVVQTAFATTALALLRASLGEDLGGAVVDARVALAQCLDPAWVQAEQIAFLGQGWTVGLAQEAALKAREASLSFTEAYPAMDYRHGPIALAEPGRLVWMFGQAPEGLEAQVKDTGATWISCGLDPMADLVRAQRLAVARGLGRGLDPDHPRHLARSVVLRRA